jgi:hypothetical protein
MIHVKAFQAAAKWWADHLRDINYKQQTGDDAMDMFATVQLATRPKLKKEQIDAFESELEKKIIKSYKNWIKSCEFGDIDFRNKYYSFGVDYDPCALIAEAAKKAGLSDKDMALRLPVKTDMGIKPTCVIVTNYQQDCQTIYKSASS